MNESLSRINPDLNSPESSRLSRQPANQSIALSRISRCVAISVISATSEIILSLKV